MNEFKETQRFRQAWVWVVIIITAVTAIGLPLYLEYKQHRPVDAAAAVLTAIVPLLVILLFKFSRLDTAINEEGITYRFRPFHFREHKILWSEVAAAEVRKYSPLGDYGGWGIRYSFGKGKAYNVSGNKGLQLELKNNKLILIGTNKPEELESFMNELYRKGISAKFKPGTDRF